MKILIIANDIKGLDGWGRSSRDLARGLAEAGHSVVCAVSSDHRAVQGTAAVPMSHIRQEEIIEEASSYLYSSRATRRTVPALQALIDDCRPDIIHIIAEPYQHILPFLALNGKTKVVATLNGTYAYIPALFRNPWKKLMATLLYVRAIRRIDTFIIISSYTKERLCAFLLPRLLGVCVHSTIIPPVIIQSVSPVRENDRKNARMASQGLLYVGAVKPRKGLDRIIMALAAYKKLYSKIPSLTVVGRYDPAARFYPKLREIIQHEGLEESIFFRGRVEDDELEKLYGMAAAFIMLSVDSDRTFEGFGMVYVEANARGVPAIGSRDSAARDAIAEGRSGLLVDPDDSAAVAAAIHRILEEHVIDSRNCQEWAAAHAPSVIIDRITAIYRESLDKHS